MIALIALVSSASTLLLSAYIHTRLESDLKKIREQQKQSNNIKPTEESTSDILDYANE